LRKIKFHHFPVDLSENDYREAFEASALYLKNTFPECSIYKVGGERVCLGISDLDFLVVKNQPINGNNLYLRNFPRDFSRNGLLLHEPFAVDNITYSWLNRLTSFKLDLLYTDGNGESQEMLETREIYDYFRLSYYLVINYPMVFLEWRATNQIHVRSTLTKLKKLFNLESLIQEIMGQDHEILSKEFREQLTLLVNEHSKLSPPILQEKILILLDKVQEVIVRAFTVFEELALKLGLAINVESSATINRKKLDFSNRWKEELQTGQVFHLPASLGGFNRIFSHIDPKFMGNVSFSSSPPEIPAFDEISRVINQYLHYCERSNILQLIFDIDFSVTGHNSIQYRFYQAMSRIKNVF
jgi:hypothetical protein